MRAFARIGVLVKMRAVEVGESVGVARKVGGRPVQNHAESCGVAAIHEVHELVGLAVTAGGREVADGLVAP